MCIVPEPLKPLGYGLRKIYHYQHDNKTITLHDKQTAFQYDVTSIHYAASTMAAYASARRRKSPRPDSPVFSQRNNTECPESCRLF
mmetsp:Transcript_36180/g.76042  ORF Transcript_36180/g.76042 Transcript_36180/m.76042 type:complete len:86 (+) Transcript_36180:52-309(+)